jgi:hypothetical protein
VLPLQCPPPPAVVITHIGLGGLAVATFLGLSVLVCIFSHSKYKGSPPGLLFFFVSCANMPGPALGRLDQLDAVGGRALMGDSRISNF